MTLSRRTLQGHFTQSIRYHMSQPQGNMGTIKENLGKHYYFVVLGKTVRQNTMHALQKIERKTAKFIPPHFYPPNKPALSAVDCRIRGMMQDRQARRQVVSTWGTMTF